MEKKYFLIPEPKESFSNLSDALRAGQALPPETSMLVVQFVYKVTYHEGEGKELVHGHENVWM